MQVQKVEISSINVDEKIQQRASLDQEYIVEISKEIAEGAILPPLDVYDIDGDLYLADGFHRSWALIKAGVATVEVNVYKGTARDAILHAIRVNAKHGLRFTNADKRKAVTTLLNEWGSLSDGQIAEICCVSQPFVGKVCKELTQNGFERDSQRLGKDGRLIDTANIGAQLKTDESEDSQATEDEGALRPEAEMTNADENEESHNSKGNDVVSPPDAGSEVVADLAATKNDDIQSDGGVDETKSADDEDLSTEAESPPDSGSGDEPGADDESSDQTEEGDSELDGNDGGSADESASTTSDEEKPIPASSSGEQTSQVDGEESESDCIEFSSEEATDAASDDISLSDSEAYEVQTLKTRVAELENTIVEKDQRIEELEAENAELQSLIQELEEQLITSNDSAESAEEVASSPIY